MVFVLLVMVFLRELSLATRDISGWSEIKLKNLIYSEQIFSGRLVWIINLHLDNMQIYVST